MGGRSSEAPVPDRRGRADQQRRACGASAGRTRGGGYQGPGTFGPTFPVETGLGSVAQLDAPGGDTVAKQYKYQLEESQIPTSWYNITADFANPPTPPLHPGTGQPAGPDDLAPLFPMGVIQQEMAPDRYIDIPEPVLDAYKNYRATPMFRAHKLEEALQTPAHIYYKYEGSSPVGSHKVNTAIAQAYYNAEEGVKRIATETGAGQWGSALAYACQAFEIELKVYMVKVSFEQKPYRKALMNVYGASVVPSPTMETEAGRKVLADDPDTTGSLGIGRGLS